MAAWHEHMMHGHHLVAKHSKNLLLKVVEKHPIVASVLALTGGVVIFKKLSAAPASGTHGTGPVL